MGDLVGVNKDSYLVLEKLPTEYDSRVKAMEVDERPTDQYSDIGGLDKQIQELIEAIVLPMTHAEMFKNIGIVPPKAPAIIFIDELDAIGMKRSGGGELSGVREVQRTMLELLNQLDGFSSDNRVKVVAATNRPDVLDPALLRSGRLDRKIELPHPNEDARARIMQIHSRKMNYNKDNVNFTELARMSEDFNGAQLKAVCVEAGMEALRRSATELVHEDYVAGIATVQAKKKSALNYYA